MALTNTFGTTDQYIKRQEVGSGANAPAATLSNGGITFGTAMAISNLASGGSIGTAATTVDVNSIFLVNQTTASQTLTLPTPTTTSEYKVIIVSNVGSASFTMLSQSIAAGASLMAVYTGSAWSYVA